MKGRLPAVWLLVVLALFSPAWSSSRPWIEQISWQPRAYVYHNFLTDQEAEHIIEKARPTMARSSVLNDDNSVSAAHEIRTSSGTFLRFAADDTISAIEKRVSQWTRIPVANFEAMQVLKYVDGQKYGPHWDDYNGDKGPMVVQSSLRVCTVIMYLSDVEYGGETAFPKGHWLDAGRQNRTEFSTCASTGPSALARKGDAVLFWGMKPDGQSLDHFSLHTGCPVLKGEKWSATLWIHGGRIRRE